MHRRGLLRATGVAATVGVAGCLGYTIESKDDVQQRKDRIDELESELERKEAEVEDLEAEIGELESEIEQLQSSVDQKDEEIASLESDVGTLKAEKVSSLYALGYARVGAANQTVQQADAAKNEEKYRKAGGLWLRAEGEINGAHAAFQDAGGLAEEEGLSSVVDPIEQSRLWAKHYSEACLNFANGFLWLSRGDDSTASDYFDAGEQALSQAQQYKLSEPSAIDSELGL